VPRFIYLHGFASSPRSTNAAFSSEGLPRLGHSVDMPDLEEGDCEGLAVTRQLAVVRQEIARAPGDLALIGSSSRVLWLDSGPELVDQLATMRNQAAEFCGLGSP
jgi:predicted esterase YcpF (UPF0227 family)